MLGVSRIVIALAALSAVTFPNAEVPTLDRSANLRDRSVVRAPAAPTSQVFAPNQVEYYLSDDGVAYIRPGLKLKVNSVTIGDDRRPVVDLTFTDNMDQPLDRLGKITPGPLSISFIGAVYSGDTREYTAYTTRTVTTPASSPRPGVTATQASSDTAGVAGWTDLAMGRATYKFKTPIPAGVPADATQTIGIYSTRNLTEILGKNYYANVEYDFRVDGAKVTTVWDKMSNASCNNCHDPLSAHGGSRQDVKLCVLCHNPQTVDPDTGESQDMDTLVHKIHRGENLPSVVGGKPYIIIGFQQSVLDFSEVVFPQDIRNCDNCHEGINATQKTTQSHVWFTYPSKHACFACHDNINLETGEGHPGGAQANNATCATCHVADSGNEFDASIKGAHTIELKSKQLKGINVKFVSASNMKAGEKPTVTFKVTNGDGSAVDGSKLSTFSPIIAGPTSSYTKYFRETGAGKATFDAATGNTTYTFTNAIPADAKGTWAVSGDFYRTVTIKGNEGKDTSVRESAYNPLSYHSIDGSKVEPRRVVFTDALCNTCHDRLALHGGQRMNMQECVICHNPTVTDVAVRIAGAGAPESVSMQRMIHRIHTGEELEQEYSVYGNRSSFHPYNQVLYPGDLRNCAKCHVAGTQNVPGKGDPVVTPRDYYSPQGPGAAACLGCHDSRDAAAHAFINTTNFGREGVTAEACGACHGAGAELSADQVHAR